MGNSLSILQTLPPAQKMPTVFPNKTTKVLVSGANGYIAVWVVRTLLEKGYSVRGTVRSEDKGTYLKRIFADYGDKFELAIVPDIVKVRRAWWL